MKRSMTGTSTQAVRLLELILPKMQQLDILLFFLMFRREARLFSQIAHAEKFEVEKNVENVQFDYVADLAASDTNYE